jgi:alpha-tubulin suppressor-like RCC1 family protein
VKRVALALTALLLAACELDVPSSGLSIDAGGLLPPDADAGALECPENPCQNGGSCALTTDSFQCSCPPGYEGELCDVDVDDCDPNPCRNDGFCSDRVAGYECACAPGFSGVDCSTNIDECADEPCQNAGTCTDMTNDFSCDCVAGFNGVRCEVNVDDCDPNPCQNGGTCSDDINGFECACTNGNTGTDCSNQVELCTADTCKNGATCTDSPDGYVCTCLAGYNGPTCDNNIDDCSAVPCLNGGACTDEVNGFSCACEVGFEGTTCENRSDPCDPNPCSGHGSCMSADDDYVCSCEVGYQGRNCEDNTDDCIENPCQNNATCVDGVNGFTCTCVNGHTGVVCDDNVDPCPADEAENPCQNGGVCNDAAGNGYLCECKKGYKGRHCEVDIDYCMPNPCKQDAACTDDTVNHTFLCECPEGYRGYSCEFTVDDCADEPCKNNGTCTDLDRRYECSCAAGWGGPTCETDIDDCNPNQCLNGGTCTDALNGYTCECTFVAEGPRCEITFCDMMSTCGHGVCNDNGGCDCAAGWDGERCDINLNDCEPNMCVHGSCEDGDNMFMCVCEPGHEGTLCDTCVTGYQDRDGDGYCCRDGHEGVGCLECEDGYEPKNGDCVKTCESTGLDEACGDYGTCVENDGNPYCDCDATYEGEFCDSLAGTCAPNSCNTNGTCTDTTFENTPSYRCDCNAWSSGRSCEVSNECLGQTNGGPTVCYNGGSCTDLMVGYDCTCLPGYFEPDCEEVDDCWMADNSPGSNGACNGHGTCTDGDNTYTCACTDPSYTGTHCEVFNACVNNTSCLNGSTCVDNQNDNGFTCNCSGTDYGGTFCENRVDNCPTQNPCQNGGRCVDGDQTYACDCSRTGYTGATCSDALDECTATPTICGDGTCNELAAGGGYSCKCPDGTLDVDSNGTRCAVPDKLVAGPYNTCAITAQGALICWGANDYSQLTEAGSNPMGPTRIGTGLGWQSIGLGLNHVCGVRSEHLYCWGSNVHRQAGGVPLQRTPAELRPDRTWKEVSLGDEHSCALTTADALYCWGNSTDGQAGATLEPGVVFDVDAPTQIPGTYASVSAGAKHTCAVNAAGQLFCWGNNEKGQVGAAPPAKVEASAAVAIPVPGGGTWSSVKAGEKHTCATAASGTYCWGEGLEGELGTGVDTDTSAPNMPVSTPLTLASLQAGKQFSCGAADSGNGSDPIDIHCWGSNAFSLLLSNVAGASTPQEVSTTTYQSWKLYAVGRTHMCAVSNNRLYCWGDNNSAALGNGGWSSTPVDTPTAVVAPDATPHSATDACSPNPCENGGTCATNSMTGAFSCTCLPGTSGPTCATQTSECTAGICGPDSQCIDTPDPGYTCQCYDGLIDVTGEGTSCSKVAKIAAGHNQTCVITEAKTLHCWGSNRFGQMGQGNPGSYYEDENSQTVRTPLRVRVTGDTNGWNDVTSGDSHVCATLAPASQGGNEGLYCWGSNDLGEIGASTAPNNFAGVPLALDSSTTWSRLAASWNHTCATTTSGVTRCWGVNDNGETGDEAPGAPIEFASTVALPPGETTWTAASAGSFHSCAIGGTGTAYCWGGPFPNPDFPPYAGQLGNGPIGPSAAPTAVVLAQSFSVIETDWEHSCGLSGGDAYCWGNGSLGALGTGEARQGSDFPSHDVPTLVAGGLSFSSLHLGEFTSCGLVVIPSTSPQAYRLYCWGSGDSGQTLTGTLNTPTQVTIRTWSVFALGRQHSCGVDAAEGLLYCWGDNGEEDGFGQGKLGYLPNSLKGNYSLGAVKAAPVKHPIAP